VEVRWDIVVVHYQTKTGEECSINIIVFNVDMKRRQEKDD
jgi:hypothetical protein